MTGEASRRTRLGAAAALVVFALYGAMSVTVDLPATIGGFYSDNATYFLMGHSLAADGDLEYRRADLERAYREFPSGPSGIFLKRGTDVEGVRLTGRPPFIEFSGTADPNTSRLYFGKSFAYPLMAAPLIWVFGTNGFLLLNALLVTVAFWAVYTFTALRSGPVVGLLWAGAFVFASVVPVFVVWTAPELFNWALAVVAYFLWLHKSAGLDLLPGSSRWRGRWTDLVAAAIIGFLTYSKVTNILLFLPMGAWWLWSREWRRLVVSGALCVAVACAAFGVNVAVTGEWNYQGGTRATCYGPYPFQQPDLGLDDVCDVRGRDEAQGNVIFDPDVFWTNLRANLGYFVFGRNSGLVAYYFPLVFAAAALLFARGRREPWQWFVLAAIVIQSLVFIVALPYSYFGGGGTVGNRYFIAVYGAGAFLLPALRHSAWLAIPWGVGSLFVAQLVFNPFQASVRPADHAKGGAFRMLPVELTNLNDLPLMTEEARIRIWYGDTGEGNPGFQIYYLDDNSYLQEADRLSFWTRGESDAQFLIKTDYPYTQLRLTLTAGAVATTTRVAFAGETHERTLLPGQSTILQLSMGPGFPYKKDRVSPAYVWPISVSSSAGFVPAMTEGSHDRRFLGVRVKPIIVR